MVKSYQFQHTRRNKINSRLLTKFSLIMKLNLIFFVLSMNVVFASHSYAQKTVLSLDMKNTTVSEVLDEIERQSEFRFYYNSKLVDTKRKVSVNAKQEDVFAVLNQIFSTSNIGYKVVDKDVILVERDINIGSPQLTFIRQGIKISGTVLDENRDPMPGVNIMIKGTTTGVASDLDGKYTINVPDKDVMLVYSFIGYVTNESLVGDQTIIDIQLSLTTQEIEEVVVVGYGSLKKKDFTGAVSQVKGEQMEKESPKNVQDMLMGNVPGLNVSYDASPRGGGDLLVRGKSSLTAGTSPLLVVDGVIYYGQLVDINPSDIESIDVLKDASSAAVYGAKAASGVVLITTKKGSSDKPVVSFRADFGLATMAKHQKLLSPDELMTWRQNVMENIHPNNEPYYFADPRTLPSDISVDDWMSYTAASGDPVSVWLQRLTFQNEQIKNYLAGNTVDWYDMVFKNGFRQDYTVSLSGKKDAVSYYMSLQYLNNEGIIVGNEFSTIRGRLNLEGKANKFITAGVNLQFADRDESSVAVNWERMVTNTPYGSMYNPDGSLKFSPDSDEGSLLTNNARNPFLDREYTDRLDKTRTLFSTLYLKGTLPFGFSYNINFTPRYNFYRRFNAISSLHYNYASIGGESFRRNTETFDWQIDNIIKWDMTFNNKHRFDVTLLANAEKYQSWEHRMTNQGFEPNDDLGYHDIASGINPVITSTDEYSTGDALMARLNYTLMQRYLLTLSIRRDGYSAFGQKNPRATFPAVALGWVFSEENFLKSVDWLNYAKLRLSYGINGNRDIGRYQAMSDLKSEKYLYAHPDGSAYQMTQLYVNRMSNANLKWERTASYNIGLDFSILKNRLGGSIEVYQKSTNDLLIKRSLPNITGYSDVMANLGEVQNKGVEVGLNSRNMESQNLIWRSILNVTVNRNKIIHLYGPINILDDNGNVIGQTEPDDPSNGWFIGRDIDAVWDYKILGVWQVEDKDEAAKYGLRPGDFKLEDVDKNGEYTDVDRQFLGYKTPRFRWTLRNEFTLFKNFDISFMLYSDWGQMKRFNWAKNTRDGTTNPEGVYLDKSSYYKMPYWTPENRINDYAANMSSGTVGYDVYRKASFIRLHNISISYNLPKILTQKAFMENMRVYFTVNNVAFYAPKWDFWDPQNNGPTPRNYTLGINVTL